LRTWTWPGPGGGTSTLATSKFSGFGMPTGRLFRRTSLEVVMVLRSPGGVQTSV